MSASAEFKGGPRDGGVLIMDPLPDVVTVRDFDGMSCRYALIFDTDESGDVARVSYKPVPEGVLEVLEG